MKRKVWFIKLFRNNRPIMAAVLLLAVVFTAVLGSKTAEKPAQEKTENPSSAIENTVSEILPIAAQTAEIGEMRAVWVPYMTLSMGEEQGEEAFREKFEEIVRNSKEKGMNALVVQVRPFSDALYPSEKYPWSHILTGEQGKDPGYDPLAIMVELAHEENMELHAWVNPLRISTSGTPQTLSEKSPYCLWKNDSEKADWITETETGIYMNPAYEGVRRWIIDGVKEIIANYDVDGVQFDDYFYPTEAQSFDQKAYQNYCEGENTPLSLQDWREANISSLIAGVYQTVKKENPQAVFGVSPQGNLQNVYNACADVYAWGAINGYVDYICPQMYVSLENEALPYEETLRTWRELVSNTDVELYVGLAVYKAGTDADNGQWQKSDEILSTELSLGRELSYDGFMFYSYDYLIGKAAKEEVENVMAVF